MGCVGFILKSRIKKSGEIGNFLSEFNDRISSAIIERLNGIRLIKLSATEEREKERIRDLSEEIRIRIKHYEITKELLERGENIILNIYVMGFLPDDVNGELEGTKVVSHKVINLEVRYEEIT